LGIHEVGGNAAAATVAQAMSGAEPTALLSFAQAAAPLALAGYLWDFTRSVLALLGAGALVWLLLRALGQRGLGKSDGPVRVLQRVVLEPRKALYLVQAGGKTLLIGCADGAAPALIAELPQDGPAPPASGVDAAVAAQDTP